MQRNKDSLGEKKKKKRAVFQQGDAVMEIATCKGFRSRVSLPPEDDRGASCPPRPRAPQHPQGVHTQGQILLQRRVQRHNKHLLFTHSLTPKHLSTSTFPEQWTRGGCCRNDFTPSPRACSYSFVSCLDRRGYKSITRQA